MFPLLLIVSLSGCADPAPPYDPAANIVRREGWRTALRASLGSAYDAPVPGLDRADLDRGQEVFGKSCSGCHGMYARGDGPQLGELAPPPPPDLVDPKSASFLSDAAQMAVIRGGSPGTVMPAMGRSLSEENLLAAYAFVGSLRLQADADARAQQH